MKVLVTGAGGFIGSHVARIAAAHGDVVALDAPGGDLARIEDLRSDMTVVLGDLADDDVIAHLAALEPEVCVHCAWYTGESYLDSPRNIDMMAATLRLAIRLGKSGCRRFVGVGTCLEYDTSGLDPLPETAPLAPGRLYSACKLGTWYALEQVARLTGMATAWARLFYIYGPWEAPSRLVPSVIAALLQGRHTVSTPGQQMRDFLHVADVASALWSVATSSIEGTVNVGSGTPFTVADILRELGAKAGHPNLVKLGALPYRPGDPMFVCANNRRLVDECGWTPTFSLSSGLAATLDWWRARVTAPSAAETGAA
jgi:nucleoside-diphosphate-sugar epimerase